MFVSDSISLVSIINRKSLVQIDALFLFTNQATWGIIYS